ncbi:MAG: D-alanine--D-alanine ligase family protein [Rikenellaceae bacterium]
MKKLHIALLAGGNSSERDIALNSAAQVAAALDTTKYDIKLVDIHHREWIYTDAKGEKHSVDRNDFSVTVDNKKELFDYALIIMHGTPGEDGMLQGYLEIMGIPFSSCSMTSSVITFDKISTKRALSGSGISLAKEVLLKKGESFDAQAIIAELGTPIFVKPNASGSSFGVSRVKCVEEMADAVALAFTESDTVLVEEAIVGREVGCGVMITSEGVEYLLPITELISKREFFDYEAKYTTGLCDEITPADLPDSIREALNKKTIAAYRACRCRGVVRIDFIVTESGEPYLIEINSIPGMSSGSIVPQQIRASAMTIGEFYDILIEDTYKSQTK